MVSSLVRRVLAVADAVPPGMVVSYGDVATMLGEAGPRQVGAVMSAHGHGVAWHRVIYADGRPPALHAAAARARWEAEGTPLLPDGRVDMGRARWRPSPLPAALSDLLI